MTLDECNDTARRVAMCLPPADFGSTRAITAFGGTLRAEILKERQSCVAILQRHHDELQETLAFGARPMASQVTGALRDAIDEISNR